MFTANSRPDQKTWVQAKLEEYRSLRLESMEAIRAQHQVLVYSLSLIGLLTAGTGQIWDKSPFVAVLIFWIAIPTLCYTFTFVWMGEVERMMRVGQYIGKVEQEVNQRIGGIPMGWESKLREGSMSNLQMRRNYLAVLFAFLSIAFAAPFAGDAAVVKLLNELAPEQWFNHAYLGYSVVRWLVVVVVVLNIVSTAVWSWMYCTVKKNGYRIISMYATPLPMT